MITVTAACNVDETLLDTETDILENNIEVVVSVVSDHQTAMIIKPIKFNITALNLD